MTAANLSDTLEAFVGSVDTVAGEGGLARTLPLAHPRFPWLFCDRIASVRGLGNHTLTSAASDLEAPAATQYAEYDNYRVQVEFTPRPYAVLPDTDIVLGTSTWTDENGNTQTVRSATEWERFTEWMEDPITEVITAQNGSLKFATSAGDPNNIPVPGGPIMRAPRVDIVCRWHQVPYRYITSSNSYLKRYQGFINQFAWAGYPAGSLLFKGTRVPKLNPPPFPARVRAYGTTTFSIERIATIELLFEYVNRTQSNVPAAASANYITSGHNLLPWFGDRKFYYVVGTGNVPTYFSVEFSALFADPDA